jgi:hypothetical protein
MQSNMSSKQMLYLFSIEGIPINWFALHVQNSFIVHSLQLSNILLYNTYYLNSTSYSIANWGSGVLVIKDVTV